MLQYIIGIAGATGVVGKELLKLLEERNFPVKDLKLFASEKSKGKKILFKSKKYELDLITKETLKGCDFVFGCTKSNIAKEVASLLKGTSSIFIDNSSAFRYDKDIPLVIPEVNMNHIKNQSKIIANPNCTAIILAIPLWPIHEKFNIKRLIVSTYQAVSGAGQKAMEELENQTIQYVNHEPLSKKIFLEQILFNIQSHNSAVEENGFNGEENKVIKEIKKIFNYLDLKISATCIRVPVLRAHVESINFEVEKECKVEQIKELLSQSKGIKIIDDKEKNNFPTSLKASDQDLVLVGRIRQDLSYPNKGFHLLIAGDQLRKGAALNALQIAEKILEMNKY